jgi:hypothetical protein
MEVEALSDWPALHAAAIWEEPPPLSSMYCYHTSGARGAADGAAAAGGADFDFLHLLAGEQGAAPALAPPPALAPALAPPAGQVALHNGAAAAPSGLRCLDSNHAPSCARCTPPPADADTAAFVLRGEKGALRTVGRVRTFFALGAAPLNPTREPLCGAAAGAKNGEKKLRGQLCRTRQWGDVAAREAAAVAAEQEGMPELASALRTHIAGASRQLRSGRACVRAPPCVHR